MKTLEKITLIIYSNIMLIISVILCLLIFRWLDFDTVGDIMETILTGSVTSNIVLAISVIFILLSIKCIFFDSTSREQLKEKQGVLLENDNGKLMISKDTLENLVNSVAKDFESAEEITTRVELEKENQVNVYVNLVVSPNAVIKELSTNLQTKIKERIKMATDLDVKEVNIKIRNVTPKTEIRKD